MKRSLKQMKQMHQTGGSEDLKCFEAEMMSTV